MADRPNPLKLNPLQAKTLALLQELARQPRYANPPDADGAIMVRIESLQAGAVNSVRTGPLSTTRPR